MNAGPVAHGSASNTNTLVLTLTRDVDCECVVHVCPYVWWNDAAAVGVYNLANVVDSHGNVLGNADTGAGGGIGYTAQSFGAHVPQTWLGIGPSAIRAYSPGVLNNGDTITLTWAETGTPPPDECGALVFAISGVTINAEKQTTPQDPPDSYVHDFGDGDASFTNTLTDNLWGFDFGPLPFPSADAAALSVQALFPADTAFDFVTPGGGGLFIGGQVSLAVQLAPRIFASAGYEPGGSWQDPGKLIVGNYQFLRLV